MLSNSLLGKAKEEFDWDCYVVSNYEIMHTNGSGESRICCPNCGDRKFKCYVNADKGVFNCFKCDFHTSKKYDVVHFIAKTEGISYVAALLKLTSEYAPKAISTEAMEDWVVGLGGEAGSQQPTPTFTVTLPAVARALTFSADDVVWQYAKKRGITETMIRDAGALGLYEDPLYGTRLLFPIYSGDAKLSSWQARDITGKSKAKYVSAPKSKLAEVVWPNVSTVKTAVLVEGIIDALSIRRSTAYSSYATFGKHISAKQCVALSLLGAERVILWYDKRDAKADMIKAVRLLKDYVDAVYVVSFDDWPTEVDVGDLLRVSSSLSAGMINKQLSGAIDCSSLDYQRWCQCP
jgi:DNA primase